MVRIRPAGNADVARIVSIHNALLHTTTYEWTDLDHTPEEWRVRLAHKAERGEPVLVGEDQGEVVAWATYGDFRDAARWPGYRFTVEHTIHVDEHCWGRGLGRQLLGELMDRAEHAGKRVMVAGIDATNVGSISFHQRCGFAEVARMPGVGEKFGRRLDLVLMQAGLGQGAR